MKIQGTSYYKLASILLIVIAIAHLAAHFGFDKPANETEARLLSLMENYRKPVPGGSMSVKSILDGLNLCYALFLFSLGYTNLAIAKAAAPPGRPWKFAAIAALTFFFCVAISALYFSWIHVLYFLVVTTCFCAAAVRLRAEIQKSYS